MTTASELLRGVGAGGPFITDPRDMVKTLATDTFIYPNGTSSVVSITDTTFWDKFTSLGGLVTATAWTTNVYKTIADVSGRGLVSQIIGPWLVAASTDGSIRITIDGAVYEWSVTGVNVRRMLFGAFFGLGGGGAGALYNSQEPAAGFGEAIQATPYKNGFLQAGTQVLPSFGESLKRNQVLKFVDGFKVEAKVSVDPSGGQLGIYTGVMYRPAN